MSAPVRVLVTPKDENPYQRLLYDELRAAGAEVLFTEGPSGSQTFNLLAAPVMLAWHRLHGYRILHIHWVFHFSLPWARQAQVARLVMQWWFRFYLWSAGALGYRVVWTAHDLLPHSQVFSDDYLARRYLIGWAATVIALSNSSAAELRELGAANVTVIPFGSYAEPYPRTLERKKARSELGLGEGDVAVLLIGKIEPYKGVDLLLDAAASLPASSPVKVIVAGACGDASYRATLLDLAGRVGARAVVRLERIPDEEMATYLGAADFAAFPFRAVTNSSSILLAQSFALPVLIPNLKALRDVPDEGALRYDPHEGSLAETLERAARLTAGARSEMGRAAKAYADAMDWPTVARLHLETYSRLLGQPRRVSRRHH
ncbi:MAG: glycosyltransferase family 4 protein [Acidimicrobiales bacterium]